MKGDQTGGKLLGYGRYGCAFDKPLVCKKKRTITKKGTGAGGDEEAPLHVGKLTDPSGAQTELRAAERIAKLQGIEDYVVLLTDSCTPAPRNKQTEPDLKDCPVLKTTPLTQMTQLIMPFGGKALFDIPMRSTSLDYVRLGQHLLEAGTLLLMGKVVHFDLHALNVLMSSRWKGKLIDFGMSWSPEALSLSNLSSLHRTFNPEISQEPPEVTYINGRLSKLSPDLAIQKTMADKIPLKQYALLFNQSPTLLDNAFRLFLRTSWAMRNEQWFTYYSVYWSKIDAWAIGSLLLDVYISLLNDRDFLESPAFLENRSKMETAIRHLCWVDPSDRYDCAEALAIWAPQSPVLDRIDVVEWLQTQHTVREELATAQRGATEAK